MRRYSLLATLGTISLFSLYNIAACSKNSSESPGQVCNITGSYAGTFSNPNVQNAPFAYTLSTDNFLSGAATAGANPTAFGSYYNTCDSVVLRSWNSINGNYYYFSGRFSNNRATITGTYRNINIPSETGPFTLNKQ